MSFPDIRAAKPCHKVIVHFVDDEDCAETPEFQVNSDKLPHSGTYRMAANYFADLADRVEKEVRREREEEEKCLT